MMMVDVLKSVNVILCCMETGSSVFENFLFCFKLKEKFDHISVFFFFFCQNYDMFLKACLFSKLGMLKMSCVIHDALIEIELFIGKKLLILVF